jgi:cyclic pyranopterin phosphate synthase
MSALDTFKRPLRDLRISVTDRCNFRCNYCMPDDQYDWIEKAGILSYEEIRRLARIFVSLGVEKVRLTGGEPLVRQDLSVLVSALSKLSLELSLTTNGALLTRDKAHELADAGLSRINISLDTPRDDRFSSLTRRGELRDVLSGIEAAQAAGLDPIKINAVIIRGVNDDEIVDLLEFARERRLTLRYIEYMDVGTANDWSLEKTVTQKEIVEALKQHVSLEEAGRIDDRAPAVDYRFDNDGKLGIIASVSEPFCGGCSRARLTADGKLVTCLFATAGFDLRTFLRDGSGDDEIRAIIEALWQRRADRFSEDRLEAQSAHSSPFRVA